MSLRLYLYSIIFIDNTIYRLVALQWKINWRSVPVTRNIIVISKEYKWLLMIAESRGLYR